MADLDTVSIPTHCPTCGASLKGQKNCRRCKTDCGPLADIAKRADRHKRSALDAFDAAKADEMFFHARRSFSLRQTPAGMQVLACAALLTRRFELAAVLWRRMAKTGAHSTTGHCRTS